MRKKGKKFRSGMEEFLGEDFRERLLDYGAYGVISPTQPTPKELEEAAQKKAEFKKLMSKLKALEKLISEEEKEEKALRSKEDGIDE